MPYNPPVYNFGQGLMVLPPAQRIDGGAISDEASGACSVTLDHAPFSLITAYFYTLHDAALAGSLNITAAVAALNSAAVAAGNTLDYVRVSFAVELTGIVGLASCGDTAYGTASFDGQGPMGAVSNPAHGWNTDWQVNGLTMTADDTAAEMAASYNVSGVVFTTLYEQEVPPGSTDITFAGDLLRPTAHTWPGQDATNTADRIMFAPGEITTVAWNIGTASVGKVTSGGFALTVAGYMKIGGTITRPDTFMCVL